MDFEFDTEQNDLRSAVRGLLERAYGENEQRRKVVASDPGYDEKLWSRLAEMGLLGLPFAEEHGGVGAGPVEVAIVAEEIGRVLAPEPFVEAVVLAGGLIGAVGSDEQKSRLLTGIAEGTLIVAFAHAEPGTRWTAEAAGVRATQDGDGWQLSGTKEPVLERGPRRRADRQRGDRRRDPAVRRRGRRRGPHPHRLPDARRRPGRPHRVRRHPGEPCWAGPAATPGGSSTPSRRPGSPTRTRPSASMSSAITATSDYLKTRKQFGVTLSTFQALTFRAADMYVSLELARSTALWATARDRRRRGRRRGGRLAHAARPARPAGTSARRASSSTAASASRPSSPPATASAGSPRSTTCSATATGRWPAWPTGSISTRRWIRSARRSSEPFVRAVRPGRSSGPRDQRRSTHAASTQRPDRAGHRLHPGHRRSPSPPGSPAPAPGSRSTAAPRNACARRSSDLRTEYRRRVRSRPPPTSPPTRARGAPRALPDVDILVNNLGIFGAQPALEINDDEWRRYFEVNVLSAVRLTRAYLPGHARSAAGAGS